MLQEKLWDGNVVQPYTQKAQQNPLTFRCVRQASQIVSSLAGSTLAMSVVCLLQINALSQRAESGEAEGLPASEAEVDR